MMEKVFCSRDDKRVKLELSTLARIVPSLIGPKIMNKI